MNDIEKQTGLKYEVVVDHKETAKKCTILPLRYRSDFTISRFNGDKLREPFKAEVLLHPDGETLDKISLPKVTAIAALDCVWRRLETILNGVTGEVPTLVSIPPGFETAYPRKSKLTPDPDGGFATIEAIFIAAAFLGHWDVSLLKEYYFADKFLEMNDDVFIKYGIKPEAKN